MIRSSLPQFRPAARQGFALVIVLIVISVLALVAIGFLSSMSQERATSSALANKSIAEQNAQAGVDTAIGTLRDYFRAFPDSATVWEAQSFNSGKAATDADYSNDGTTFYFHAVPGSNGPNPNPNPGDTTANSTSGNGPNNVTTSGADARTIYALPLVSGATAAVAAGRTVPTATADVNKYVDLNARRYLGDDQGWLGTAPDYNYSSNHVPKPVRVPWVEVTHTDTTTGVNMAVGRYAFWVEDESFRANVSYVNQDSRQPASLSRADNSDKYGNFLLSPTDVNLVGTLSALGDLNPTNTAQSILSVRASYPGGASSGVFPENGAFSHAPGLSSTTTNGMRFLTTSVSSALNLSRHGTQRLNLNSLIPQTAASQATMQDQIDGLVAAIKFHVPSFSQRFYRTAITPTGLNALTVPVDTAVTQHQAIYTYKVAANIRDYIDADGVPTIINAKGYQAPGSTTADTGGHVRYGTKQNLAFAPYSGQQDGPSEIWAQGKDAAPFIEECAMRVRGGPGRDASNAQTGDASKYTLAIDFYVEVWNMSNVPVVASSLGPHPVIRIVNPTKWVAMPNSLDLPSSDSAPYNGSPSGTRNVLPAQRDYEIDVSGVTFAPGVATVITTDPDWHDALKDITGASPISTEGATHVYKCNFYIDPTLTAYAGKRVFNGPMPTGTTYISMIFGGDTASTAHTTSSDYETEIIFTTDNGAIDTIAGGMPIYNNGSTSINLTAGGGTSFGYLLLGGHLHGNNYTTYPAVTGDPRGNNEQLEYALFKTNSTVDQTRYFNPTSTAPLSFGVPDANYVVPGSGGSIAPWADYYAFPASPYKMNASNAPAIIANNTLTSIGQLGDVYDPSRYVPPVGTANAIVNARGGGRTFKIGQHDDLWDGDPSSASRTWTSWRLTDFFCVNDAMIQPGLVNINGVGRDNGAALRAALCGFYFQTYTVGTAQPAGQALNTNAAKPGLQAVINQIRARVATPLASPASTYSNPPSPTSNLFVGSSNDHTGSGPFFERGELSELPAFGQNIYQQGGANATNITASNDLVSSVNMAVVFDREREELFRRLAELITTRGNVFTVYAMGQSLAPVAASDTNPRKVTATQQLRVTFALLPKTVGGADFYPATGPTADRYSKPDHYDVKVLSATSGAR